MPYIVTVTNQVKSIGITESPAYNVLVQDPTTAQFNITETANTVSIFESLSTTSIYLNAIELKLNDLNDFWRGEWVADTADYLHGDLVSYEYSVFLLSVYSEDGTAFYPASDVPPTSDSNWIRLVWHEAPFQYIVDNGSLDVYGVSTFHNTAVTDGALIANGTSTFNALATFNSDLNAESNLIVYGDLSVGGSSEGYKLLIRGDSKFDGNVYIANTATFAGTVDFINNNLINGNPTFTGNVTFSNNLNVDSLVINDTLYINGLAYPHEKGLYGQVLTTNGVDTADWVNLGDLVFWSLSDDLRTNGHRIVTGSDSEGLVIGVGPAGVDPTTRIEFSSDQVGNFEVIEIGVGPFTQTGTDRYSRARFDHRTIDLRTKGFGSSVVIASGTDPLYPILSGSTIAVSGSGITLDSRNNISIVSDDDVTINAGARFQLNGDVVKLISTNDIDLDPGNEKFINILGTLKFADGTTQNTANTGSGQTYTLPTASANTLGGVKIGSSVAVVNQVLNIVKASDTQIGGIRVGNNLSIDVDGILSAVGAGFYTLPEATASTLGGIKVSGAFTLTGGTLVYTPPKATSYDWGVVRVGSTLNVNDGIIEYNLPIASTSTLGGIRIGENLSIDGSGVVSAVGAGFYNLPTATSSVLGGIKVGSTLAINTSGSLNYLLPTADSSILGGIKVGSTLDINNSVLDYNLPTATSNVLGGVKVGRNLSIDSYGVLNANTGTFADRVSLTQDMSTNDFDIQSGENSFARIQGSQILLQNNTATIKLNSSGIEVSSTNLNVSSTGTVRIGIGNEVQQSVLNVNRIYNYNGNYAPLFPAGIQFGDQTVQRTAFEPDNGLLPPVINYIGTVAYADAELFAALAPTPQYYDGITTLDNGHVWVFIAEGYPSLVPGWYDIG